MCGRYVMSKATGDLLSRFAAKEIEGSPPPPSSKVAPTQDVAIIAERLDEDSVDRRLLIARADVRRYSRRPSKLCVRGVSGRRLPSRLSLGEVSDVYVIHCRIAADGVEKK